MGLAGPQGRGATGPFFSGPQVLHKAKQSGNLHRMDFEIFTIFHYCIDEAF